VLEWIQRYISFFNGDPNEVSLWGHSSGAGSVTQHLVAQGGKVQGPALFKRVVLMDPGYDYHVERKGHLERQFREYEEYAGCKGKGVWCLRARPISVLMKAQKRQLDGLPGRKPGVGCD
jgi:carboxylesterase type B